MNAFYENIIKKLGEESFKKIQASKIGIAGAGGLGSNCAPNLVRTGFRRITIVDFDIIDCSNLDRQFYFADQVGMYKVEAIKINLCRINPDLELSAINSKVEAGNVERLFGDCDVIAECLDSAENKSMLVSSAIKLGKFTVTVSGLGGYGRSDDIRIRKIKDNLVVIGDLESDISARPAVSPRVNVAAAKQADVILEHVINSIPQKKVKKILDKV